MSSSGQDGNPSSSFDITNLAASAGKAWDDKVSEASKAWEEQLRSAGEAATAALDAGVAKASAAVRAGLAEVARDSGAVKSRLTQFYETGAAHYAATEQQAIDALKKGVRFVTQEHPDASLAAGMAMAAVLLPGPRKFLLRQTLGRFRSEEAMYKSAELRYKALQEKVEAHNGDLQKLQERLRLAEAEYERGLAKLKSTAGELESLGSRVQSSSKATKALVGDLRQLPSKQALQLRSDAANTAAAAQTQLSAVEKSLRRLAKAYGI